MELVTLGVMGFGVVAWALRLEGRVNTQAQTNEQFQASIKETLESEFSALDKRLSRIEAAIIGRAFGDRK
jgi:RNase H-fold protein (predicted Holliday junction resolvase)